MLSRFRLLPGILVALALVAITPEVKAQDAGPPFDIDAIAAKTEHTKQDITLHLDIDLAHFGEIDVGTIGISPQMPVTLTRSTTIADILGENLARPAPNMERDPPNYVDCGLTSIEFVNTDANASVYHRRR